MKSRQINFFVMPDEWEPLENYLKENNMISVARKMETKEIEIKSIKQNSFFNYLLNENNKDKIKIYYLEKPNSYFIDFTFSPVIEYSPSFYNEEKKELKMGRFYYTTGFWNENDEWEEKPKEFIKNSEKLFHWFKQNYKNANLSDWKGYTISEKVKQKIQNKELRLSQL